MDNLHTFRKAERLCSRRMMEELFGGGKPSLSAYPLRAVYMARTPREGEAQVQVLISVSKRRFKHAVDRNRVKRQVREAYRLQRHILTQALPQYTGLAIAFLWLSSEKTDTATVMQKTGNLLQRIAEHLPSAS